MEKQRRKGEACSVASLKPGMPPLQVSMSQSIVAERDLRGQAALMGRPFVQTDWAADIHLASQFEFHI